MILWNKILYDPWDDCFRDPKLAKYALDQTTHKFIDSVSALFSRGSKDLTINVAFTEGSHEKDHRTLREAT